MRVSCFLLLLVSFCYSLSVTRQGTSNSGGVSISPSYSQSIGCYSFSGQYYGIASFSGTYFTCEVRQLACLSNCTSYSASSSYNYGSSLAGRIHNITTSVTVVDPWGGVASASCSGASCRADVSQRVVGSPSCRANLYFPSGSTVSQCGSCSYNCSGDSGECGYTGGDLLALNVSTANCQVTFDVFNLQCQGADAALCEQHGWGGGGGGLSYCTHPLPVSDNRCADNQGLYYAGSRMELFAIAAGLPDPGSGAFWSEFSDQSAATAVRPDGSRCNFGTAAGTLFEFVYCPSGSKSAPEPEPEPDLDCESNPWLPSFLCPSSGSGDGDSSASSGGDDGDSSASSGGGDGGYSSASSGDTDWCAKYPSSFLCGGEGYDGSGSGSGSGGGNDGGNNGGNDGGGNNGGNDGGGGSGGNGSASSGVGCKDLSKCDWAKLDIQLDELGVAREMRDRLRSILDSLAAGHATTRLQAETLRQILDYLEYHYGDLSDIIGRGNDSIVAALGRGNAAVSDSVGRMRSDILGGLKSLSDSLSGAIRGLYPSSGSGSSPGGTSCHASLSSAQNALSSFASACDNAGGEPSYLVNSSAYDGWHCVVGECIGRSGGNGSGNGGSGSGNGDGPGEGEGGGLLGLLDGIKGDLGDLLDWLFGSDPGGDPVDANADEGYSDPVFSGDTSLASLSLDTGGVAFVRSAGSSFKGALESVYGGSLEAFSLSQCTCEAFVNASGGGNSSGGIIPVSGAIAVFKSFFCNSSSWLGFDFISLLRAFIKVALGVVLLRWAMEAV